jgi:hypothetical protein
MLKENTRGRDTRFRRMDDRHLEDEIARLEREVDKLDDATWPSARALSVWLLDELYAGLAERERRRT